MDCHELMAVANDVFYMDIIKPYPLSIPGENRGSDENIKNACNIHRNIYTTLDALTAIIRIMKNGIPQELDCREAEKHLGNLLKLWDD